MLIFRNIPNSRPCQKDSYKFRALDLLTGYALQKPLAAYSPDFEGKNEVLTYISHLAKLNSAIYPTQTK